MRREFRQAHAFNQAVLTGAEVAGQVRPASFDIVIGQTRRCVRRRDHNHSRFADDGHGALGGAGTIRADRADDSRVGRQSLRCRLTAFCRAQAVFDHQFDLTVKQRVIPRQQGQFDTAKRILAQIIDRAGYHQHRANNDWIVGLHLYTAQRVIADIVSLRIAAEALETELAR